MIFSVTLKISGLLYIVARYACCSIYACMRKGQCDIINHSIVNVGGGRHVDGFDPVAIDCCVVIKKSNALWSINYTLNLARAVAIDLSPCCQPSIIVVISCETISRTAFSL